MAKNIIILAVALVLSAVPGVDASSIVLTQGDLIALDMLPTSLPVGLKPTIFNEYTDYQLPKFSDLDPSDPRLHGAPPSKIPNWIDIDTTAPGTYPETTPMPGKIEAGTWLTSYILSFNPGTEPGLEVTASGSVTFDRDIIALQYDFNTFNLLRENLFNGSSLIAGMSGVDFCDPGGLGCDTFTLSNDLRTLSFAFDSIGATDDMRIFLETPQPVPEPATISLLVTGLCGVGLAARRRLVPQVSHG